MQVQVPKGIKLFKQIDLRLFITLNIWDSSATTMLSKLTRLSYFEEGLHLILYLILFHHFRIPFFPFLLVFSLFSPRSSFYSLFSFPLKIRKSTKTLSQPLCANSKERLPVDFLLPKLSIFPQLIPYLPNLWSLYAFMDCVSR